MQIPTTNGVLEANFHQQQPGSEPRSVAVLCHPHPQYGGSMHDLVLEQSAQCFRSHLRFNFRGVGASSGSFDAGIGEVQDVVSAWQWTMDQDEWDERILVGYSFGAAMAWRAQHLCTGIDRLILIAPPSASMEFSSQDGPAPTIGVIVGSQDAYFSATNLPQDWRPVIIDGADHFFTAKHGELANALGALSTLG